MRVRGIAGAAFVAVAIAGACTNDFDAFEIGRGGISVDGSANGGSENLGGSSGTSGGSPGTSGGGGGAQSGGASGAGDAFTEGGAGSGGAAPGSGGTPDAGPMCLPTQKLCGNTCVGRDSPATGCDSTTCTPCALANTGTAQCAGGACASLTCTTGFDDCDTSRSNGCEVDATTDARNCGGCANDCTRQNGKSCAASLCGCTASSQCEGGTPAATTTCDVGSGLCHCDVATCQHGESCRAGACSCNGQAACATGRTCCRSPIGCQNLATDAGSCGACGHACPSGFVCVSGGCQCNGDRDCSNGTAGTCSGGTCHCGASACAPGERCLPSGQCG